MNNFRHTLISMIREYALHSPDNIFIYHLGTDYRLTYAEAWKISLKLFQLFDKYNITKKDRIAFLVPNHWLIYPLLIACNMKQASLLPLDPNLHRDELSVVIADVSPKLIIALDTASLPKASAKQAVIHISNFLEEIDKVELINESIVQDNETFGSSVVLMIYTSGTTGKSKIVMLTADNLFANAHALSQRYQINQHDRFFCSLPTFHMNALMITGMVPLVAGASIYLGDILSFKNAKFFWQTLLKFEITICSLVPSIMALLLKVSPDLPQKLDKLRLGFCGAAPLKADLWRRFEEIFSFPIYQGYGLTETTCWAVSVLPEVKHNYNTVGVPLNCTEIKIDTIVSDQSESFIFEEMKQSSNYQVIRFGEIQIKGSIVTSGYFNNRELTKSLMTKDGFYRTGDLGYFDHNGELYVVGRTKDIIIKNGTNIFSQQIDYIMQQHPAIKESKTIGIADELVGERIYTACVIDNTHSVSLEQLHLWAHDHLSHHMLPDSFQLLGYLPKGSVGKISVGVLRKIITGELANEIFSLLNSWKYKRSQASSPEKILANIQAALSNGTPISFLSYWGCGPRDRICDVDRQTLDRLYEYINLARLVPRALPTLTLIFTDVHAQNNRIPRDRMTHYFGSIRKYAVDLGFECILLSEIWDRAGISPDDLHSVINTSVFDQQWQSLPLKGMLILQARKHLENSTSFEAAAKYYYLACCTESKLITKQFPTTIFMTFNMPDFDFLLPDLPKVYLYSYKKGTSVKPWFIELSEATQDNVKILEME